MSRKKKETIAENVADETVEETAEDVFLSKNRTDTIASIINALSVLPKDRLDAVMEAIGTAEVNKDEAEVAEKEAAEKALKESIEKDLVEAFGDENMPEAMRTRISTLFESALNTRLNLEIEQLTEAYEEQIEEEVAARVEELTEAINEYISYAAEEWIAENEVAVENTLRNEIAESFLEYIREGFMAHNMYVPEGAEDMVEALEDRLAEVEGRLNEMYEENIDLKAILNESSREDIVEELAEGLTMAEASKLQQLAEGIDADSAEMFATKVGILREKHFPKSTTRGPTNGLILETVDENEEVIEEKTPNASMAKYMSTLNAMTNPLPSKK